MYEIDFQNPVRVHFIGIGGISMSGLAEVLLEKGFSVSGSDSKKSVMTQSLEAKGVRVYYGQKASNIKGDEKIVVYTAAVGPSNPEYQKAQEMGIPMLSRAQLLGQLMRCYPTAVAVAGTHGKTTTTSMLAQILIEANTDPTISVGGILPSIGGNIRVGGSDVFLTEACEYTNSFLSFFPTLGIILNMDADHLDFFSGIEDIRRSFRAFAELLPEDGALIINADTPHYEDIRNGLKCETITFSLEGRGDYQAEDITWDKYGHASFTVTRNGEPGNVSTEKVSTGKVFIGNYYLKVPGIHNVSNALAAIAAARYLQIPDEAIVKGLGSFTGTERRFEYKGQVGGVTIIDDYAHHPTEIAATLAAAEAVSHRKLWCVFQPHTFSRTKALLPQFASALSKAGHVVLADIYAARETDDLGISSADLRDEIVRLGTPCEYLLSFDEIEQFLLANCASGDLVITMGAGDIVRVGEHLLGK